MTRIPITRHDADGTIVDGTAHLQDDDRGMVVNDFRDLDGNKLTLPGGSTFVVDLDDGTQLRSMWMQRETVAARPLRTLWVPDEDTGRRPVFNEKGFRQRTARRFLAPAIAALRRQRRGWWKR